MDNCSCGHIKVIRIINNFISFLGHRKTCSSNRVSVTRKGHSINLNLVNPFIGLHVLESGGCKCRNSDCHMWVGWPKNSFGLRLDMSCFSLGNVPPKISLLFSIRHGRSTISSHLPTNSANACNWRCFSLTRSRVLPGNHSQMKLTCLSIFGLRATTRTQLPN